MDLVVKFREGVDDEVELTRAELAHSAVNYSQSISLSNISVTRRTRPISSCIVSIKI